MEETESADVQVVNGLIVDPMDPRIVDVYADNGFISVGNSDVSILFASTIPATNKILPSFRVRMTYASFLSLMSVWNKRRDFVVEAFNDSPISLMELDQEKISKMFEDLKEGK